MYIELSFKPELEIQRCDDLCVTGCSPLKNYSSGSLVNISWLYIVTSNSISIIHVLYAGIILCMRRANERRHYSVTSSLIGCVKRVEVRWLVFSLPIAVQTQRSSEAFETINFARLSPPPHHFQMRATTITGSAANLATLPPQGGYNINSLAPGRYGNNFKTIIFKLIIQNCLRWRPQNLINEKSTLVQVMGWCHQATSNCLSQLCVAIWCH